MDGLAQSFLQTLTAHAGWIVAIVFAASFLESLVLISFAVPGTAILFAAGTMAEVIPIGPTLLAAVFGATLGDGLSYWLGRRFSESLQRTWPFTKYPDVIPNGIAFFERHGGKSVFLGRFFGPARATVPLAAGLLRMAPGRFWVMNVTSALVWAPLTLSAGIFFRETTESILDAEETISIGLIALGVVGLLGIALARWRRR